MRFFLFFAFAAVLSACTTPGLSVYSQSDTHGLQSCFSQLTAFKKEVNRQQVNDVQVVNHKAFPYLAFDRFSQSQLELIETKSDRHQWLDYTAQLAARQRQVEYSNMIVNHFELPVLNACADKLVTEAKHNDYVWAEIIDQPLSISDSYEPWLRVFGLYPISSQVATSAIDKEKKKILAGFNDPASRTIQYQFAKTSKASSTITHTQIENWFSDSLAESTLRWPMLSNNQISQLYHYYSPVIEVETASDDDIPGTIRFVASEQKPTVDTLKPTIYLHHSYTQLYGKTYLQLNYSLWFANRTPTSSFDPYAGEFDGVILRLTLDHQGRPILLDSIHHCGCYHMVFNLTDRFVFENAKPDTETPLMFHRHAPSGPPSWSVALSHGEHMIKQVTWNKHDDADIKTAAKTENEIQNLTSLDYDQLRQLPSDRHHTISLFDQRGLLPSSERLESTYLWPFGIPSAGAMRQLGHHAIAFIGIRHFDEPRLFEQLLRPEKSR